MNEKLLNQHQRGELFFRLPRGFVLTEPTNIQIPSLRLSGIQLATDNFQSVVQCGNRFYILHNNWMVKQKKPRDRKEPKTGKASNSTTQQKISQEVDYLMSLTIK